VKSKILRRFESFVLKDTIEDEDPTMTHTQIDHYDKLIKSPGAYDVNNTSFNKSTHPFKIATTKPSLKIRPGYD
jgi:hypothetical protein